MSWSDVESLEIGSPEADDQSPFMGYHRTEFWKKLDVGVVTVADPKTVLAATKDLCRHFVAQENPTLFMAKAAKLAAQFRNLEGGRLAELLVNHGGLQKLFTLDPAVRFDLRASSSFSDRRFGKSSSEKSSVSSKKRSFLSWYQGLNCCKKKNLKQPLTIVEDDWPTPRLRLTFSPVCLYRLEDKAWLEAFISSVDELTEAQALVFGPAFACLFIVLKMEAREPSGIAEVAEEMAKVCDTSSVRLPSKVAQMVGRIAVKMPPPNQLTKLLSVYAAVKLPPVYFNTVVGGLMYARHHRQWSLSSKKDSMTFVLMFILWYQCDQTPLLSSLDCIEALAERRRCPRMAELYFAFVELRFPESWRAFCHVVENFDIFEPAKYDPFWHFSRAFSDRAFDELSYERNHRVCNITAVVEDLLDNLPGDEFIYEELVREKPTSLRISGDDLLLAQEICNALRIELGEPSSSCHRCLNRFRI